MLSLNKNGNYTTKVNQQNRNFTEVYNQPSRSTQPSTLCGMVK